MKICIYGLSYNNEKEIESWYNSVKFADLIFLADLGSTDNTMNLLKKNHIKNIQLSEKLKRADYAKNKCIEIIHDIASDMDLFINVDANENLTKESISYINTISNTSNNAAQYCYSCKIKSDNREFFETKIHSNCRNYFWEYPIKGKLSFNKDNYFFKVEEKIPQICIFRKNNNLNDIQKMDLYNIRLLEDLEGKDIWGRLFLVENNPYDELNIRTLMGVLENYHEITVEQYAYGNYLIGVYYEKKDPIKSIDFYKKCINILPEWSAPYNNMIELYNKYKLYNLSNKLLKEKYLCKKNLCLYIDKKEK